MLLATLKILGLIIFIGPALFVLLCSISGCQASLFDNLKKKIAAPLIIGAGMYMLPLLLEGLINFEDISSGLELLNIILVPLFLYIFIKPERLPGKISLLSGIIIGLIIIVLHAVSSHSGLQAGLYPFLSLIVHLLAVSLWAGGLVLLLILHFADGDLGDYPKQLEFQFFKFSIFLLILLMVSGSILMVTNVHNFSVMNFTRYGAYLNIKFYLAGIIIFTTLFEIIRIKRLHFQTIVNTPHSEPEAIRKSPFLNIVKIILVFLAVSYSGVLTRVNPPDIAPFINPQSWDLLIADQDVRIDMQPVAGSTTDIRFEIFFPQQLMQMTPLFVNFDLYIPGYDIGIYGGEALQVSQNSFQGEATLPEPGTWQLDLNINMTDGSILAASHIFILPAQPLVEDIRTYLSFSSITYNKSNLITFFVGIGLVLVYSWLTQRSLSKAISIRLALTGIFGLSMGIYMLMSVVLVKTYPSTYWKNPQTYSSASIQQGEIKFIEHCGECHGNSGGGEGPWAIENRGRIPGLGSPHMDVHTDGEVYWWVTGGIPSLDMPPLGEEIAEIDRWNIINYVRSLRHGIP